MTQTIEQITDLSAATPTEVDTEIAAHVRVTRQLAAIVDRSRNLILDHAGMREYVRAQGRQRGYYRNTGTFEEAREVVERRLAAYDAEHDLGYDRMSEDARAACGTQDYDRRYLADHDAADLELAVVRDRIRELDDEFSRRGGWTRFYLVTSSDGHIHSSQFCSTCRATTTYGWMPSLSGQTEEQAIASLEDLTPRGGSALCSVCFPSAPVEHTGGRITKARAIKLDASAA